MGNAQTRQSETPLYRRRLRQFFAIALALTGLWIWREAESFGAIGTVRWILILLAMALALTSPIARTMGRGLDRIRHPSRRAMRRTTLAIAILASGYLLLTARLQGRDLFPKMHDECSYLIGMQMLARGKLCMPALPLPDFFDSFYILVRPAYASIYFIGTALLFVPTIWLHLPIWLMPIMVAGAIVGMMYRIFAELIDGVAGLLAALLTVSISAFRDFSIMLTGHLPMLLMGLILFAAWMRWRESQRLRWAIVMGVAAGWAAITRPADAVVYAAPVAVAVLAALLRPRPGRFKSLAVMVLSALPFLALQVAFNRQVTGNALLSPYTFYIAQDMPGSQFGFHPYDPQLCPASSLAQKRQLYATFVQQNLAMHEVHRVAELWHIRNLPYLHRTAMPQRLLIIPACIGLLGLIERVRWVLWATLPLFVLVFSFNPFFIPHYALLMIPAVVLMIILGGEAIAAAWPRFQRQISNVFVAMLLTVCLTSLWELDHFLTFTPNRALDETEPSADLKAIDRLLKSVQKPAVVLFRYHRGSFLQEPVYNLDTAWPDDAPIIRAHDLGPARNQELFDYYARTQPDRTIYSYDNRRGEPLMRLGKADELKGSGR
jgi:4-amino-4-deoxy-L-arabinose transferase-like glycosyltransferase